MKNVKIKHCEAIESNKKKKKKLKKRYLKNKILRN